MDPWYCCPFIQHRKPEDNPGATNLQTIVPPVQTASDSGMRAPDDLLQKGDPQLPFTYLLHYYCSIFGPDNPCTLTD